MKKTMFKKVLAGIAAVFTIGLCVPTGFTGTDFKPSFETVAERSRLGKDGGWQDMYRTEYKIEGDTLIINDCDRTGNFNNFISYDFQSYAADIKHLEIGSGWEIDTVWLYLSSIQSLKVGDNCTIDQTAFRECTALESVTIGNGCTIEYEAFWECTALESVEIGNDCRLADFINERNDNMGNKAFWDCTALTDVTIGNGCTIGEMAFWYCTALKNVTIGDNCTIEFWAFDECNSIQKVSCIGDKNTVTVDNKNPEIIRNKDKWTIITGTICPKCYGNVIDFKCKSCGYFDKAAAQAEIEKHKAEIDRIQKLIDAGNNTASTFSDGSVLAIIGCSTFLILCGLAAVIVVKRRKKTQ